MPVVVVLTPRLAFGLTLLLLAASYAISASWA